MYFWCDNPAVTVWFESCVEVQCLVDRPSDPDLCIEWTQSLQHVTYCHAPVEDAQGPRPSAPRLFAETTDAGTSFFFRRQSRDSSWIISSGSRSFVESESENTDGVKGEETSIVEMLSLKDVRGLFISLFVSRYLNNPYI